jgi:hypothetical protein
MQAIGDKNQGPSFIPLSEPQTKLYATYVDLHNIKIDLREIGWDGVDWVNLAQDRDHWRVL